MRVERAAMLELQADPTIDSLCGGRIYHLSKPADAVHPCITFLRAGTNRGKTLDGPDTLSEVRVQFDCWHVTSDGSSASAQVKALAEAVRSVLDGFRGDMQGETVQYCHLESEYDLGDIDGDTKTRRVTMDFIFTLHE